VANHVRPEERNPIEGKFGQAKNGLWMNRIRARLKGASQSWIAFIILVLNLVKLAGMELVCLGFSAWKSLFYQIYCRTKLILEAVQLKTQSYSVSGLGLYSLEGLSFSADPNLALN
tara:strand:+ start:101158 stop:101505 length:348 start_codon:yes stop_codon:yes gene_type:complete